LRHWRVGGRQHGSPRRRGVRRRRAPGRWTGRDTNGDADPDRRRVQEPEPEWDDRLWRGAQRGRAQSGELDVRGLGQGREPDLRRWNVVRTAAEVNANYRTEFGGAQPGLVANWRFDESSGPTAFDNAGSSAQNMGLLGGAGFSPDVP